MSRVFPHEKGPKRGRGRLATVHTSTAIINPKIRETFTLRRTTCYGGFNDGARPGPNPHKRGRASYHPLLCRERKRGLVVNSRLRPGDTHTATGAVAFVRQSVARLPPARRRSVLIRADRGFDADTLSAMCEERGWHDLVKLRVTALLASRLWTHATEGRWRRLDPLEPEAGEVAEFRFQRPSGRAPAA